MSSVKTQSPMKWPNLIRYPNPSRSAGHHAGARGLSAPREFLFFNRNATGKLAANSFVNRLEERTVDRDKSMSTKGFRTELKAIQRFGRSTPSDLSKITQPTLIANGDNDRMVPSVLSEDLHRRIKGSELVIYPDSGHGGIFQYHDAFAPVAVEFLGR